MHIMAFSLGSAQKNYSSSTEELDQYAEKHHQGGSERHSIHSVWISENCLRNKKADEHDHRTLDKEALGKADSPPETQRRRRNKMAKRDYEGDSQRRRQIEDAIGKNEPRFLDIDAHHLGWVVHYLLKVELPQDSVELGRAVPDAWLYTFDARLGGSVAIRRDSK